MYAVKRSTKLYGLYMALGKMPLSVFWQIRMLTYWSRIIKSQGPFVCSVYAMLRHDADQGHTYNNLNGASHIKSFLDQLDFPTFGWTKMIYPVSPYHRFGNFYLTSVISLLLLLLMAPRYFTINIKQNANWNHI